MTAWSTSKHPGRIWLRHSITLVLGAVAVCLLLAGLVRAVVGADRETPVSDVTAESIPEPAADDNTLAAPASTETIEVAPPADEPIDMPPLVERRMAPPAVPIVLTDDGGADASPDADIPQAVAVVGGPDDAGRVDGGPSDAGPSDAGLPDTGPDDAAPIDAASDATPAIQMPMIPSSAWCGRNTCNVGELCCNASCGFCVRPGQTCDRERKCSGDIEYIGESQMCGMQTCNVGYACCNPSCGICKRPGEPCSQTPCT